MAKSNTKGLATVLSFEKKIVLSDGLMYGTIWDERQGKATALPLHEKSVRGTISNRQKPAVANDPAKLNAEVENRICRPLMRHHFPWIRIPWKLRSR